VPESIRAFDDLLDQWEPTEDLSGVPTPPDDLSQICPPPDEPPFPHELFQDEIPEETFADWFLSRDNAPNDPLPEQLLWDTMRKANAGVT
jgi:hypothetical protein